MLRSETTIAIACAVLFLQAAPREARGQTGTTLTPDGISYLVSKDVPTASGGAERWAISMNLIAILDLEAGMPVVEPSSMSTITGNVFKSDGSPPSFVFCQVKEPRPNICEKDAEVRLICRGASPCEDTARGCSREDWDVLLDDDLAIPMSFFLPSGGAGHPMCNLPVARLGFWENALAALSGFRWRAVQLLATPAHLDLEIVSRAQAQSNDRGVTATTELQNFLVNKDVGAERWSISLNRIPTLRATRLSLSQVHSVTGNVYRSDGGTPSFVYCEVREESTGKLEDASSTFRFSCSGTDACLSNAEECSKSAWTAIRDDVPLEASFFLPVNGLPPTFSDDGVFVEAVAAAPPAIGSAIYTLEPGGNVESVSGGVSCSEDVACFVPILGTCQDVEGRLRLAGGGCICRVAQVSPACITCGGDSCGQACSYAVGVETVQARGLCLPHSSSDANCLCYAFRSDGQPPVESCGGTAGTSCPSGRCCSDDPSDGCDPSRGDLSCPGLCIDSGGCDPSSQQCGSCSAPPCGNGRIEPAEECDGENLDGQTCQSLGRGPGELRCSEACQLDASACGPLAFCGNGRLDPGEDCDGTDLAGATCELFNRGGGALACTPECVFSVVGCDEPRNCEDLPVGPCESEPVHTDPARPWDLRACVSFGCLTGTCNPETGQCE